MIRGISKVDRARGSVMTAIGLAAAMPFGVIAPAQAQAAAPAPAPTGRAFNIPAQPLPDALIQFATQSGLQVASDGAVIQGASTNGVRGEMSAAAALSQLLSGTGFTFRINGTVVTIARAPTSANGAIALGPVRVDGGAGSRGAPGSLDPSATENSRSYLGSIASATKGTAIKDTPQSLTVLTRQRIEDQNLTSLATALDQVAGVTSQLAMGDRAIFYSRGFVINTYRIDGGAPLSYTFTNYDAASSMDMAQYDHIEVVRGADSLLSGAGEPGGIINFARKRPLADRQLIAEAAIGSWQNHRAMLDLTGPVAAEGRLRARVVGAYNDRDYFYDDASSKKALVYGIVEADVTDRTLVALGGSYQRTSGVPNRNGLPRYLNGDSLDLPRSEALIYPWGRLTENRYEVFGRFEQSIGERWKLTVNSTYNDQRSDNDAAFSDGGVDPVTLIGPIVLGSRVKTQIEQLGVDVNLQGAFDAFGQTHQVTLGADWQDAHATWHSRGYSNDFRFQPVDVFNFDPLQRPDYQATINPALHYKQKQMGFYGSLRLAVTDDLTLIAGGRLASYKYIQDFYYANGYTRVREKGIFTPFFGAVYAVTPALSLYANISEAYKSQANRLSGPLPGTSLGPVRGHNYEAGVKGELFEGRLLATAAIYRINRNGEAVQDPSYPSTIGEANLNCCYVARGKVVSQGVDVEINGELAEGLSLSFGYTFNDNEDKQAGVSRYSTITPRHLLKLWSDYQFPGRLAAFSIGAGATMQSRQFVSGSVFALNTQTGVFDGAESRFDFTQKAYAVFNAKAGWKINDRLSAAINVNNIFDKTYYQTLGGVNAGNYYGEPRNFAVTLRGKI